MYPVSSTLREQQRSTYNAEYVLCTLGPGDYFAQDLVMREHAKRHGGAASANTGEGADTSARLRGSSRDSCGAEKAPNTLIHELDGISCSSAKEPRTPRL